jgi:PBP1b-binding outer membrane lipoprotein LpoB
MNKVTRLVMVVFLLSGCSQKVRSVNTECQDIEREMLELMQKKNLNLTAKVVSVMANGYPYGQSSKVLEQKIKVLNMKLQSCQKRE